MAPTRTRDPANNASTSAKQQRKHPKQTYDFNDKKLGVQKIKSSLRQTRRLLAKDSLAADKRVETERRLKALETDLAKAEASKKERTIAVRYHKIKFFERQKLVRKINQAKKKLSDETSDALTASLYDLRVDLNYVLHYPKTKKYISLFPPEIRSSDQPTLPIHDPEREAVRSWIRDRMDKGELSNEPELNIDSQHTAADGDADSQWVSSAKSNLKSNHSNRAKQHPREVEESDGLEADDFFEDDNDD